MTAREITALSGAETVSSVLSSVSACGGKISAFSYELGKSPPSLIGDGPAGKCLFSIYGKGGEEAVSSRCCVASLGSGVPRFELSVPFWQSGRMEDEAPPEDGGSRRIFSYEDELLSVTELRMRLRGLGAVIEGEHNCEARTEISFSVGMSVLCSCLRVCAESAEKSAWTEERVSVSERCGRLVENAPFRLNRRSDDARSCCVRLIFRKRLFGMASAPGTQRGLSVPGEILSLCARYAYLFGRELPLSPARRLPALFFRRMARMPVIREKVGEIRRYDGQTLVCYRNGGGAMTLRKKRAANARRNPFGRKRSSSAQRPLPLSGPRRERRRRRRKKSTMK